MQDTEEQRFEDEEPRDVIQNLEKLIEEDDQLHGRGVRNLRINTQQIQATVTPMKNRQMRV